MDSATEEIYFQKLEELIQDDDKIVTIPSLANILKISVQDSRYLLSKYTSDNRKLKPNELFLTYILTGYLKGKGNAVILVKEIDLKEKRTLFDKIESEHLFSVQKCKEIDFNVLSLVHDVTQASESPLLGSIISKNCVKRILKVKKLPSPPPSTIKGKSSFFLPKIESASSTEKSTESTTSKTDSKGKQNGIASMFSKAGTQTNKGKENTEKKSAIGNSTNGKSKGGLSSFLSKGSSTTIKSENGIKKENSKTNESQISDFEELMEVDFQELDEDIETTIKKEKPNIKEESIEIKEEIKPEVQETKKGKKKSDGKEKKSKNKRQREKSEEKAVKKRKRIVERNDSESDDLFENDEGDDIIEKSDDEPERVPSPDPIKNLAPKNKIRKAVDKTYMDEEGFLVTKTEYVYESAPEDDEKEPVKIEKEKPKLEKKNSVSSENDSSPKNAKGKKGKKNNMQNQPTLMNFFKKK